MGQDVGWGRATKIEFASTNVLSDRQLQSFPTLAELSATPQFRTSGAQIRLHMIDPGLTHPEDDIAPRTGFHRDSAASR